MWTARLCFSVAERWERGQTKLCIEHGLRDVTGDSAMKQLPQLTRGSWGGWMAGPGVHRGRVATVGHKRPRIFKVFST
jgi:hypothetical protein